MNNLGRTDADHLRGRRHHLCWRPLPLQPVASAVGLLDLRHHRLDELTPSENTWIPACPIQPPSTKRKAIAPKTPHQPTCHEIVSVGLILPCRYEGLVPLNGSP